MKTTDREIAEQYCRQYGIEVHQARYREDGRWYHHLTRFPAAFIDKDGYIIFETKQDYESCKHLDLQQDVNVPSKKGIKVIPGYVRFVDAHNVANSPVYPIPSPNSDNKVADSETQFDEGGTREIAMEIQRRNPQLKRTAIRQYGTKCQVCQFDFGVAYGPLGEGFIELHHLKPLSISHGDVITTLSDVALVCSNCHRMLHRSGARPISVDELRQIIKKLRTA
jgi:HNH endonuclease